jgi:hypothetical protein
MTGMTDMHLMLVDGKVVEVDLGPMLRRHRDAHIRARADAIDQAASMFGDECFDIEETYETCEAAGLANGVVNSAAHIALVLAEVERWGLLGE